MSRNEPEVWAKTAQIGFLNSFLAARLTGNVAVDWTQASYSGLFRLKAPNGWCEELVRAVGLPKRILPPVLRPFDRVGVVTVEAAAATGLQAGTPVAIGAADTAAAAFALGIEAAGQCFESFGTSAVITFSLDRPDFDAAFLNRCHIVPGRWLVHGAMSTPGAALAWLREKIWPDLATLADLERLAASSDPGSRGVVFLPYLAGERSPIWDPEASGAWIGLRLDTTRADLARAVYEAAAYGLRQILERATERWGYRPTSMLCVGGGALSTLLLQIQADVMGIVIYAANVPDAAALGAAMLGGIAAEVYSGVDDPALPKLHAGSEGIRPGRRTDRQAYEAAFAVYRTLYPALRNAMHLLAR